MRLPLLIAAAAGLLAAAPAAAHEAKAGAITVVHPLLRASIGKSPNTAGYMTVKNAGSTPDRLLSASCACAKATSAHKTTVANGVSRMLPSGPVVIPAGGEVTFAPGGLHLMLTGLTQPAEAGTTRQVTLTFEKAGVIKAPFFVTTRVEEELKAHGAKSGHAGHN